jgi:hypothetical protein
MHIRIWGSDDQKLLIFTVETKIQGSLKPSKENIQHFKQNLHLSIFMRIRINDTAKKIKI